MIKPIGDLEAAFIGDLFNIQAYLDVIHRDRRYPVAVGYRKVYAALGIGLVMLAESDGALPYRAADQQPCRE